VSKLLSIFLLLLLISYARADDINDVGALSANTGDIVGPNDDLQMPPPPLPLAPPGSSARICDDTGCRWISGSPSSDQPESADAQRDVVCTAAGCTFAIVERRLPSCSRFELAYQTVLAIAEAEQARGRLAIPHLVFVSEVTHEVGSIASGWPGLLVTVCIGFDLETGEQIEYRQAGGRIDERTFEATCSTPIPCETGHTYVLMSEVAASGESWIHDPTHVADLTTYFEGLCEDGGAQ